MLKSELLRINRKLTEAQKALKEALTQIRYEAQDATKKGHTINNLWLAQRTTEALTKSQTILERP